VSETCRVIINQVIQKLHLVGYLLTRYFKDARYHEKKKCILSAFACSRRESITLSCPSAGLSVPLSACTNLATTGRISVKFDIVDIYENLPRKSEFGQNYPKISGPSHEYLLMFECFWRHEIVIQALSSSEMVSGF